MKSIFRSTGLIYSFAGFVTLILYVYAGRLIEVDTVNTPIFILIFFCLSFHTWAWFGWYKKNRLTRTGFFWEQ